MPKIVDKQPNQWMQKVRQENFLKGVAKCSLNTRWRSKLPSSKLYLTLQYTTFCDTIRITIKKPKNVCDASQANFLQFSKVFFWEKITVHQACNSFPLMGKQKSKWRRRRRLFAWCLWFVFLKVVCLKNFIRPICHLALMAFKIFWHELICYFNSYLILIIKPFPL